MSTAVTVTVPVPVLVVCPASIRSSRFELNLKSDDVAGATADADTVSVTASLVAPLSRAVTRLTPPSTISSGVRTSVTVGREGIVGVTGKYGS